MKAIAIPGLKNLAKGKVTLFSKYGTRIDMNTGESIKMEAFLEGLVVTITCILGEKAVRRVTNKAIKRAVANITK